MPPVLASLKCFARRSPIGQCATALRRVACSCVASASKSQDKVRNRMTLGPLDYLVVGFPGNQFKGEIAPAIAEARAKGIIRIVDLVFVMKDENGATTTLEITDLPEQIKDAFAAVGEEADGLLTGEDIDTL